MADTPRVLLDANDLAYMRETQTEVRPTEAELFPRTSNPDGSGGRVFGWDSAGAVAIRVRIVKVNDNTASDDVPRDLAAKYGVSDLRKVVMDLVAVNAGDLLHDVDRDRWYELVSDARTQEWTTAHICWAAPTTKRPVSGVS